MDVAVDLKSGYRWLRPAKKPSVLGGGLLERARSTTLALLGVTTAVGLAMVALALNQSWPVIADSPLPVGPPRHEAVGEASVAAGAIANAADPSPDRAGGSRGSSSSQSDGGGSPAPADGSVPTAPTELVVAPSAPAEPGGDAPRGTQETPASPSPDAETPQAPATPVPVSSAPAQPEPAPPSPPTAETPPPPTSAKVPVDSSGDEESEENDGDDDDGDWDDDWSGDRGYGRGGRWSRGHHGD